MRRIVMSLIVVLCALGAAPRRAAAQCHESCAFLYGPTGKIIGRGCVIDSDALTWCLATASTCITGDCNGAFITDANGAVLAEADICRDKVTVRPVTRRGKVIASKPDQRRVAKPERATE
jgi:hypothetical protein